MFRIEVWLSKTIEENTLNELIQYLKTNLGCEKIIARDIE